VAGYSGTPLPKKLGIGPGDTVALVGAPDGIDEVLGDLPAGVVVRRRAGGQADVVVCFATRRTELDRRLDAHVRMVAPDGTVWAAWPKKASGVATDITEDVVREVAFPRGLVDVKVCAIDDTWSGLKLVIRRHLRDGRR
jgi:hypothetical protein